MQLHSKGEWLFSRRLMGQGGGRAVDINDVSPRQAEKLQRALAPTVGYLFRLQRGLEKAGFLPTDLLYQLVSQAYDATHALSIEAHYLASRRTFENQPGWPNGRGGRR